MWEEKKGRSQAWAKVKEYLVGGGVITWDEEDHRQREWGKNRSLSMGTLNSQAEVLRGQCGFGEKLWAGELHLGLVSI